MPKEKQVCWFGMCPFCGGKALCHVLGEARSVAFMQCDYCGARGPLVMEKWHPKAEDRNSAAKDA